MNQNSVKVIGIKDESRKDANLSYINEAEGLKDILNKDLFECSNFDGWGRISSQQRSFSKALEVYKGEKIDINTIVAKKFIPNNFENIKKNCFGQKKRLYD